MNKTRTAFNNERQTSQRCYNTLWLRDKPAVSQGIIRQACTETLPFLWFQN